MNRIVKNCARAAFVLAGAYCFGRIFFMLGYVSAANGARGFLLGALYLTALFIAAKSMFSLYDEARRWLTARKRR